MINIPKSCDSCIHMQVCSKKDIFQGAVKDFKTWPGGSNSQDIIVEVRCAYYYGSVATFRGSLNTINEASNASNS